MAKIRRVALVVLVLVGATVRAAAAAPAPQPGYLDPTFGEGGVATIDTSPVPAWAAAVAVQPDGKLVVAGTRSVGASDDAVVMRLLADGVPDSTFGNGGEFVYDTGAAERATHVVLQPDGKILVTSSVHTGEAGVDVLRLTAAGQPDATFGTGGVVVGTRGLTVNTGRWGLGLQPDGKILVVGNTEFNGVPPENVDMQVFRYLSNGQPDPDFGTAGVALVDFSTPDQQRDDFAEAVALLPDGRIVVGGVSLAGETGGFALARLTAGGVLDSTFAGTGLVVRTGPDLASSHLFDLVAEPDGKVTAVGFADFPQEDFVVARFTATGGLDNTFGTFGVSPVRFPGQANTVVRDSRGRIVVGGYADTGGAPEYVVVRLFSDGLPDPTWGDNGRRRAHVRGGMHPVGLAVQPDGKVVAAGQAEDTFAVVRYRPGTGATTTGWNPVGQLASGTTQDQHIPVPTLALHGTTSIASGLLHGLALKGDGSVWTWGWNGVGQLGNGGTADSPSPVEVDLGQPAVAVAAGAHHNLAVTEDGHVFTWGWNAVGQLGDLTVTDRRQPTHVDNFSDVVGVAGGWYHSLALKSDGTVWAWGWNGVGELGDGTTLDRHAPVKVQGLTDVVAVAAGAFHSLALKADGTVWAWGWNGVGQLGDGTTTDRHTPVQVTGLTGVTKLASGAHHNLAIRSDGTVRAWGWNATGQLGDGTTTDRHTPVTVSGLTGATSVAAGPYHSLATTGAGDGWAWGWNGGGNFGNGTTTDSPVPMHATFTLTAFAVAAGLAHSYFLSDILP